MAKYASEKGASAAVSIRASVSSLASLTKAVSVLSSLGASVSVGVRGTNSQMISVMNKLTDAGHVSAVLSIRGDSPIK